MTDTSTQAPILPGGSSPLSDQLSTALHSAPEIGKSPGLSVGIASAGGDVQGNSQAVARGTNIISDSNAHDQVAAAVGNTNELTSALDWFGNHVVAKVADVGSDVVKGALKVASPILSTMNKPMQIVQHEYRYLHDVEATHGMTAALLEGLGIAVGAAGGLATTGSFYGADLGAEAATGIESQLFYKDSWDRTNQASYTDPNTHQQVSIGRDIISELSHLDPQLDRGTPVFKITSGLIDGIFDMNVGGTEVLGLAGRAQSAEGLGGTLGSYFPGHAPQTAEDFDNLMASPGGSTVRRAFRDIASKNAGEIANAYKPIGQQHTLLLALEHATDEDQVAQVFRNVISTHELAFMDKLPSLTRFRQPFQAAHEAMGDTTLPVVGRLFHNTSRLGEAWLEKEQLFSGTEFNPSSGLDDGTSAIYRMALYDGVTTRSEAASEASAYANANLARKGVIYRNLQLKTLFTMAGWRGYSEDEYLAAAFDDPDVRQQWKRALSEVIDRSMSGKGGIYGVNDAADTGISIVRDTETGSEFSAAITKNQTGNWQMMDLATARRISGQLAGDKDLFGKIDDFAFDHLTAPVFKRWVLMTPAYALHIALAELIPNSLRLGLSNVVRSRLEISAAEAGTKVESGEAGLITSLAYKLLRGAAKLTPHALGNSTEKEMNYAYDYIEDLGGKSVSPALSSSHNISDEILPRDQQSVSLIRRAAADSPMRTTNDFTSYGQGHTQFQTAWQASLHEVANDDASQLAAQRLKEGAASGHSLEESTAQAETDVADYLRNMTDEEKRPFYRSLPQITSFTEETPRPPDMDQFDEWARTIVANVRGITRGADKSMNIPLLDHIANGETVGDDELDAIPVAKRPLLVKGREIVPAGSSKLQDIANAGFKRVLNPIVNFLSREPIAFAEYKVQRGLLEKSVEDGIKTEDEARVAANSATVQNVIKNVHNLTDRTQWTVTLRNWAPFYFAQEQAYRRMGRLLAEDPAAFRKYQLMITNMHNVGQVFQGKNGQGYFVMPGTGFLTSGTVFAAGLIGIPVETATPVGMGWNLSASSVIFPLSAGFRPDIGPLVSLTTSSIADFFPETISPILKADMTTANAAILGPTATEPIYEQMVPNTIVQRLLTASVPGFNNVSFNSTMMQTLATLDFEGKLPPPDAGTQAIQTFVDRVRWQTRILYIAKAIYGGVTPVSPELTDPVYNQFSAEVSADITAKKSVAAGLQEFLSKHPDATPFTVWHSSSLSGSSIPSSVAAEKWIDDNYSLINTYPGAGILLMPTTGLSTKYNATVYNEQIAQSLRSKLDPQQATQDGTVPSYINALYIAAGNALFYKWYEQYENQIKGLSGTEKYDAEQSFWGNGTSGNGTVGRYILQNPVWGAWFNSDAKESDRGQAILQMTSLLKENPGIQTPIAQNTRTLLAGYKNYQNQISTLTTDGSSGSLQTQATDAWKQYLYGVAKSDPEMINVITGLFLSIPTASTPQTNIVNSNTPGVFNATKWNQQP